MSNEAKFALGALGTGLAIIALAPAAPALAVAVGVASVGAVIAGGVASSSNGGSFEDGAANGAIFSGGASMGVAGVGVMTSESAVITGSSSSTKIATSGFASKSFMTGKEGERELASLVGGESQVYKMTSLGKRFIDQLSENNIAHESKVGYTTLTARIKTQILKDYELINTGEINGAHWHFFKSGVTGKAGASQPLMDFLKLHGIEYTIHQ